MFTIAAVTENMGKIVEHYRMGKSAQDFYQLQLSFCKC